MASLTPLSKGLIAVAVVGAVVSAVWNLGLKERFGGAVAVPAPPVVGAPAVRPAPAVTAAPAPVPSPTPPAAQATAPAMGVAESAEAGRKLLDGGNFAQARVHLERAVQGGDGPSACHLGDMTLKGQGGIPIDQEKAAKLFQLAQSRNVICFAVGK